MCEWITFKWCKIHKKINICHRIEFRLSWCCAKFKGENLTFVVRAFRFHNRESTVERIWTSQRAQQRWLVPSMDMWSQYVGEICRMRVNEIEIESKCEIRPRARERTNYLNNFLSSFRRPKFRITNRGFTDRTKVFHCFSSTRIYSFKNHLDFSLRNISVG